MKLPDLHILLIFKPQPWEASEENILILEGQQGQRTSGDKYNFTEESIVEVDIRE